MPDDWHDGEQEMIRRINKMHEKALMKLGIYTLPIDESDLCIKCRGICRCLDHPWFNIKKTTPSYNWGPYR